MQRHTLPSLLYVHADAEAPAAAWTVAEAGSETAVGATNAAPTRAAETRKRLSTKGSKGRWWNVTQVRRSLRRVGCRSRLSVSGQDAGGPRAADDNSCCTPRRLASTRP